MSGEARRGADFEDAGIARKLALTVRFLLELALLAGVAVLAWRVTPAGWNWVAAVIAVVIVATIWGMFLSPKARYDIGGFARLMLEVVLFGGVAAGLITVGLVVAAAVGFVIWVIDRLALRWLR
ncbi:YrdB family protein [Microbacterium sp.]|uniref:YrdB family protein n=1 Tax=Microbacterium sp. TaxID=51671 RepID=UPI003F983795